MTDFIDFVKEETIFFSIVAAILLIIGYLAITTMHSDKITLIKEDWNCTKTDVQLLMFQQVGKVVVPIYHTVCIQYTHK